MTDRRSIGIRTEALRLGYDRRTVVHDVDVTLPAGEVTVVVGANGCGKSTLLRGCARLLTPSSGRVVVDDQDAASIAPRRFASLVGMLPQQPLAPDGITVAELVGRGRHPHQRWFRQWSAADDDAVLTAMDATSVDDLADVPVDELSGGQRQRAWIALALAQDADVMLLDEPTTFLDLAHQVEVLDLLSALNRRLGRTVVLVLHDLNMAARYADTLVMMRDGRVAAQGRPVDVVTTDVVQQVFGLETTVIPDPVVGTPMVVPHGSLAVNPRARAEVGGA